MKTFLALLRGVNVSGHNPLRMAELKTFCEGLGAAKVRTHLQSGNVVFQAKGTEKTLASTLGAAIKKEFGFDVPVLVQTAETWARVVEGNPFLGRAAIDPAFLHVTFLAAAPAAKVEKFPAAAGEEVIVEGAVVYLYCPHGYGRTKLTNTYFEKALKVPATTRNWRTVLALHELARG